MKLTNTVIVSLVLAGLNINQSQAAITIDGDLKDWINQPTASANDWTPIDSSVKYTVEDQNNANNGFLNPGWGGQAYDAEAIYIKRDVDFFYAAVVTGLSPATTLYPAGDLAFDFGNDGSYEYGVIVRTDNQTNNSLNGGIGSRGQIYQVTQWNVGLFNDAGDQVGIGQGTQQHPTSVKQGVLLNQVADVVYQQALYNGSTLPIGVMGGLHYLIEAKIPVSVFDSQLLNLPFTLHWTMGCANDAISVDPPGNVPEPQEILMLILGIGFMLFLKKQNDVAPTLV